MSKKLYTDILEGDKDLAAMAGLPLTEDIISQFHGGLINGGNFEWYASQSPKTRQTILKELTMVIPINEQTPYMRLQAWTTLGQRFRNYITTNYNPEEETDITPINVELREEDKQYEEDIKTLADLKKKLQEEDEEVESTRYEYVNHPSHYNNYDIEVIEMMRRIWGNEATSLWCEMTAFRYRMRMGTKPDNSIEQEMGKEKWYLNKAKELKPKK